MGGPPPNMRRPGRTYGRHGRPMTGVTALSARDQAHHSHDLTQIRCVLSALTRDLTGLADPASGRRVRTRSPLLSRAVEWVPTIAHVTLDIQPLTPKRIADLATLFDQGGDPKWCWCSYFRVRGRDWTNARPAENRELLRAAARRRDHAPGLVAYDEGVVVGWVSLGPRADYERLAYSRVLAPLDDVPVWSIVCFVVGRRARGRGVAGDLLAAAIDYGRDHGATTLEAYPVDVPRGERIPSASAYQGTLRMFKRAGFKVVERRQANAASPVRPIVRLAL